MSLPSDGQQPDLSVIVPAYNEEAILAESIRMLSSSLLETGVGSEIIIVNDGSRDRTGDIADGLERDLRGVNVRHQLNQGIGGAFRNGAEVATGEYVILWPADMPAAASDLRPYVERLGRADVIVGCRSTREGYSPFMLLNSWIYPRLVRALFGLRIRDVNWIHAYRRSALLAITLTQRGIPMLAEALVRLRDSGATFIEVEVAMKKRAGGVASASRISVMWRTIAGLFSFWLAWRRERREGISKSTP